jgi:hypothetical protein
MPKHLSPVSLFLVALGGAASAHASTGDASRLERFAQRARASGSVELRLRFAADRERCAAAQTCGLSGTVSVPMRFDPRRRIAVRGDVLVLPVRADAVARTRDAAAGRTCRANAKLRSAGLGFRGDDRGLLLRPLAAPDASGIADPFDTACRGPRLADLGTAALPFVRLRSVARDVSRMSLQIGAERDVRAGGFTATVTTRGRLNLRRPA